MPNVWMQSCHPNPDQRCHKTTCCNPGFCSSLHARSGRLQIRQRKPIRAARGWDAGRRRRLLVRRQVAGVPTPPPGMGSSRRIHDLSSIFFFLTGCARRAAVRRRNTIPRTATRSVAICAWTILAGVHMTGWPRLAWSRGNRQLVHAWSTGPSHMVFPGRRSLSSYRPHDSAGTFLSSSLLSARAWFRLYEDHASAAVLRASNSKSRFLWVVD